jgi:hypothetical protein
VKAGQILNSNDRFGSVSAAHRIFMSVSFPKKSQLSASAVSRGGIELVEQAIDNANLFPEPNLEIPTRGT